MSRISLDELKRAVDALELDNGSDPEAWHGEEDRLMVEVLKAIADGAQDPHVLAAVMLRTTQMQTTRWYA